MPAEPGIPTNFRLSPAAIGIISEVAEYHGLSRTAVVEMALRELHRLHRARGRVTARKESGKKSG